MGNTLTLRLPQDLRDWLEEQSRITGLPKSSIVRDQLQIARTRQARQPFMDLVGKFEGHPGSSQKRGFTR